MNALKKIALATSLMAGTATALAAEFETSACLPDGNAVAISVVVNGKDKDDAETKAKLQRVWNNTVRQFPSYESLMTQAGVNAFEMEGLKEGYNVRELRASVPRHFGKCA